MAGALPILTQEPTFKKLQEYFNAHNNDLIIKDLFAADPKRFNRFRWEWKLSRSSMYVCIYICMGVDIWVGRMPFQLQHAYDIWICFSIHTYTCEYIHTSWLCPRQAHRNLVHIVFIINVYYVGRKNISEEVEWGVWSMNFDKINNDNRILHFHYVFYCCLLIFVLA